LFLSLLLDIKVVKPISLRNLTEHVVKCGFRVNRKQHYFNVQPNTLLKINGIPFNIDSINFEIPKDISDRSLLLFWTRARIPFLTTQAELEEIVIKLEIKDIKLSQLAQENVKLESYPLFTATIE